MKELNEESKRYFLEQAAYWEVVAEDAEGFALEQAQQERRRYLRLLGMLAIEEN